jgi:hypothetical protein
MDDLERQLKSALARKDAPEWFEAKVLAAAGREQRAPDTLWQRVMAASRLRLAIAALAGAVVVATGVAWEHQRAVEERAAGEAAKAKLELALKVTRVKLQRIEHKLNDLERN